MAMQTLLPVPFMFPTSCRDILDVFIANPSSALLPTYCRGGAAGEPGRCEWWVNLAGERLRATAARH